MHSSNLRTALCRMAVVALMAGALIDLGCGGHHAASAPVLVAASDLTVPMQSTTVTALENQSFSFSNGAALSAALATQPITVTFTNTASATPTTTITAPNVVGTDGNPARFTGTTSFGSCIFRVTTSTFPVPPGPAVGDTITVNPCQVNAQTGGVQATGQATVVNIALQLGLTPSAAQQAQVSINTTTGVVTVNNVNTGQTVTLVPAHSQGGGVGR